MSEILPEGRSKELSEKLLRGAIDIHVHAGPHLTSSPRSVDPFEAAGVHVAATVRVTGALSRNNKQSPWRRRPLLLRRFQKRAGRRGRKPCRSRPACRGWRQ